MFQNSDNESSQIEVGVRTLRLKVQFYEHRRRDGGRVPAEFMYLKSNLGSTKQNQKKIEEFLPQWERLLDSLVITLKKYADQEELSQRILDLLIILANMSDALRNELVSCGIFRTLLS